MFVKKIKKYYERIRKLKNNNFYYTMSGGYCHPHCFITISKLEIFKMSDNEFEKVLQ